jgi:hypothetical protein
MPIIDSLSVGALLAGAPGAATAGMRPRLAEAYRQSG